MKNQSKKIDGVYIAKVNGKIQYNIPSEMDGSRFVKWQEKNKVAIAERIAELNS